MVCGDEKGNMWFNNLSSWSPKKPVSVALKRWMVFLSNVHVFDSDVSYRLTVTGSACLDSLGAPSSQPPSTGRSRCGTETTKNRWIRVIKFCTPSIEHSINALRHFIVEFFHLCALLFPLHQVGMFVCSGPVQALEVNPETPSQLVCGDALGKLYFLSWKE